MFYYFHRWIKLGQRMGCMRNIEITPQQSLCFQQMHTYLEPVYKFLVSLAMFPMQYSHNSWRIVSWITLRHISYRNFVSIASETSLMIPNIYKQVPNNARFVNNGSAWPFNPDPNIIRNIFFCKRINKRKCVTYVPPHMETIAQLWILERIIQSETGISI